MASCLTLFVEKRHLEVRKDNLSDYSRVLQENFIYGPKFGRTK